MPRCTRLYRLWLNLRNRCNNKRTPDYKYYGARGIRVCKRWNRFKTFAGDVGPHPGRGLTLDRTRTTGDYRPGNVRWAPRKTQSRNRLYCKMTLARACAVRRAYKPGVRQVDLAKRFGVCQRTISKIVRRESWA